MFAYSWKYIVSDIAVFALKMDVKLQPTILQIYVRTVNKKTIDTTTIVLSFVSTSFFSVPRVTDTDFCALPGSRCHDNATCFNLSTRHACQCNTGFRGDGKHCHGNYTRRGR